MALISFRSQSLLATNFISEREHLRSLKELKCKNSFRKSDNVLEQKRKLSSKNFALFKAHKLTMIASNFVRAQLLTMLSQTSQSIKNIQQLRKKIMYQYFKLGLCYHFLSGNKDRAWNIGTFNIFFFITAGYF